MCAGPCVYGRDPFVLDMLDRDSQLHMCRTRANSERQKKVPPTSLDNQMSVKRSRSLKEQEVLVVIENVSSRTKEKQPAMVCT